jgi:hypothetical protein
MEGKAEMMTRSRKWLFVLLLVAAGAAPLLSARAEGFHGGFNRPYFHGPAWHGGRGWHGFRGVDVWHHGYWNHGWHGGRFGWWWVWGGDWAFYPAPVYPYPAYPYIDAPPAYAGPAPASYWYYCDNPRGYYPYVAQCSAPWRAVPPQPSNATP